MVPVAQAAIAMIVHYPTNCKLKENHIENSDLQAIWLNKITLWSEISTHEGTECNTLITRIVRKDGSGTTYQFKHYLFEIYNGILPGSGGRTWKDLQPETEPNREWPNEASDWKRSTNNGGGGEVEEVEKISGSIGYANLSDARKGFAGGVRWLAVKNEAIGKFKFPGTTAGEPAVGTSEANCKGTNYTNKPTTVGPDDDWSEVYGGHPNNGNENYPICTLTWDIGLAMYTEADLTETEGQTAHDYLSYVVDPLGGQTDFANHDYREIEEAVGKYAVEEAALVNLGPLVRAADVNFGEIALGNTGTASVLVAALTNVIFDTPTLAPAGGQFGLGTNGCTTLLTTGAHCKIEVTFKPTVMGVSQGTLSIPALWDGHAGVGKSLSVPLKGES